MPPQFFLFFTQPWQTNAGVCAPSTCYCADEEEAGCEAVGFVCGVGTAVAEVEAGGEVGDECGVVEEGEEGVGVFEVEGD